MNLPTLTRALQLLLCFAFIGLFGCKKSQNAAPLDLVFPSDTYYVSAGSTLSLYVQRGNKQYTLHVENPDIIQAEADGSISSSGQILVQGIKRGSTMLHVRDQITGEEASLEMHVVDPFLTLEIGAGVPVVKFGDFIPNVNPLVPEETRKQIREKISSYADFEEGDVLILQKGQDARFFIFRAVDFQAGENLSAAALKHTGQYTLIPQSDETLEIQFKFEDSTAPINRIIRIHSAWAKDHLNAFWTANAHPNGPATSDADGQYFNQFFSLIKKVTPETIAAYPAVPIEFAEVAYSVHIWNNFQDFGLSIETGLLE